MRTTKRLYNAHICFYKGGCILGLEAGPGPAAFKNGQEKPEKNAQVYEASKYYHHNTTNNTTVYLYCTCPYINMFALDTLQNKLRQKMLKITTYQSSCYKVKVITHTIVQTEYNNILRIINH